MNSNKKQANVEEEFQSTQLNEVLKYRDSMRSNDMIAVSDDDQYDYTLIKNNEHKQDGEIEILNEEDEINNPNQPEGINEKDAMNDKLMDLIKKDNESIVNKKDKIDMKNQLLFLQQEQEKFEMKKHFHNLMNEMIDKDDEKKADTKQLKSMDTDYNNYIINNQLQNDMIESDVSNDEYINMNKNETIMGFETVQNENINGITYMWNDANVMQSNINKTQIENEIDSTDVIESNYKDIKRKSITLMGDINVTEKYKSVAVENRNNGQITSGLLDNIVEDKVVDDIKDDSDDIEDIMVLNKPVTLMGNEIDGNKVKFKFDSVVIEENGNSEVGQTKRDTKGSVVWNEFVQKLV